MTTRDVSVIWRLREGISVPAHLWRSGVVLLVLAVSIWLARMPSVETLGTLTGIAGVILVWRYPRPGIVLALGSMLWLPGGFGTGTYTVFPAGVLLLAGLVLMWLGRSALTRIWVLPSAAATVAIGILAASAIVSFVAGNLPWSFFAERASAASQIGGLFIFIMSASMLVLIPAQIQDLVSLKRGVIMFAILAAPSALSRGLPLVGNILNQLGLVSSIIVLGSQFWIWWLVIIAGQALFNHNLSRAKRIFLLFVGLLPLLESIANYRDWASGWLPQMIGLLTLIALRWPRLSVALAAISLLLSTAILSSLATAIVNDDLYSAVTRAEAARILLNNVIPISPIFGLGPSNYYFYTPLFPIFGYAVRFNSHNNYLDLLAQTGIVGLAAFGWLALILVTTGARLRKRVRGFARAYVNACLAGLAGMLVSGLLGDWVIPFVYNIGIDGLRTSLLGWISLGGMLAVERLSRDTIQP